jgi:hypothetical protein
MNSFSADKMHRVYNQVKLKQCEVGNHVDDCEMLRGMPQSTT